MKARISLSFLLCLMLLTVHCPRVYGQDPLDRICSVCRKSIRNCSYNGNHPKCQTCGKVIGARTDKCPYNGKHPTCSTCGKLKEQCQYKGNHPKCQTCGKVMEQCQYKGDHPKCQTCGKVKEQCPYNGNHPAPPPTTGTLSITSTPSDASVKIDGKYMGNTPLTIDSQKAGTYSVSISAEGYETTTQSITVTAGKAATCSATLKKKQTPQPVVQQPVQQPTTTTSSSASSQTITVGNVSFKMIRVDGGIFTMGATSEQGKKDPYKDEKPTHQVTLTTYFIGETEVTQALWEAVMGSNPSNFKDENRPVEQVSWDDCKTFISKLNSLTGKNFRLPTEAEWEYAARGGNKSQGYKYSGSNKLDDVGWYYENSGSETHPVKMKSPNELGLYDMSGNVWEWCQDWYGDYSSSSQTNPTGPSSGSLRVNRGGSWGISARFCRVSYRFNYSPVNRSNDLGLRLAL